MQPIDPVGTASFDTVGSYVLELLFDQLRRPSDRLALSRVCRATWAVRCELVGRAGRFIGRELACAHPRVMGVRSVAQALHASELIMRSPASRVIDAFGPYIAGSALSRYMGWFSIDELLPSAGSDPYLIRLAYYVAKDAGEPEIGEFAGSVCGHVRAESIFRRADASPSREWAMEILQLLTMDHPISHSLWSSTAPRDLAKVTERMTLSEDESDRLSARMMRVIEYAAWQRRDEHNSPMDLFDIPSASSPLQRVVEEAFIRLATPELIGSRPGDPSITTSLPMRRMRLTPNGIVLWPWSISKMQLVRDMDAIDWDDRSIDPERYRDIMYTLANAVTIEYSASRSRRYIDMFLDNRRALVRRLDPNARGYAALRAIGPASYAERCLENTPM